MSLAVDQAVSGLGAQLVNDRQEAIREIYVALGSTVRSYLQHLVGHDDADDILQRVFYEVWRHNTRYDPSRSLTAWVLGIARKRAIDHLRRRRNLAVALNDLDDAAGDDGRELAERILDALQVNLDFVADLDLGPASGAGELADRDATFGLQSDVDDGDVLFDADNSSLDDRAFLQVS